MSRTNTYVRSFLSILLIISISLMNVNTALADDSAPPQETATPTEEPVQLTEEPAEPAATETPTVEETPAAVEEVPAATEEAPAEVEETPVNEGQVPAEEEPTLFSQIPEETDVVVLDENGESLPLVSSEALDIILETDPMWCPAGVLPGGPGCTTNFSSIALLINNMISNTNAYDQAGVIYFTSNPGASFSLTTSSLGTADFNQLSDNNLILQGGWNGQNGTNAQFNGQTNFGNNFLVIGTSSNPWIGNITLNNFSFNGVSSTNAVTVYTTSGDITLNNVDVAQQSGNDYTANLVSNSGDIVVQNGSTFDGDNTGGDTNMGFNASTNTGSITITGTAANPITFIDAAGSGNLINYNGATLSAPVVTLTYVEAIDNDLNGIYISNATTVTLNNVVAGDNSDGNGTNPPGANNSVGSGVYIQGPAGGTTVNINGGLFANNERYGIEIHNGNVVIISQPTYGTGSDRNGIGTIGPNNAPDLNVPANITVEATGPAGAAVNFTVTATDVEDDPDPTPTCNRTSGSIFPIGTTTVTCSVTDSWGVNMTDSFTVRVRDTTGPVLSLPANIIQEATGPSGRAVTFTATATDLVDGPRTVLCIPGSGSTFGIGTTTVNCFSSDSRFNFSFGSFTVTIRDTTPPALNLPSNIVVEATSPAGNVVAFSATATDIVSGSRPVSCTPASNSTFPVGVTTVNCSASDTRGNTANGSFTITVQDTTPPSLHLPANITAEATSASGVTVTFSASATDIVDVSVPAVCSPASGSTFPLGITTVNCSATDSHDNSTNGSFTVTVQDTTAPIIAPHPDIIEEATSAAGAVVTYTSPSTSDAVDGAGTATCSPASGSTFAFGNTTVTCNATDTHGNAATPTTFTVTVQDTTSPTLSLPADIIIEATGPSGAVVTFTASSSDIVDGSVPVNCTPASGSIFALGTTTVNCSAADSHGNTANDSFTVTVQDTTGPELTLPANITAEATSASGAAVTFASSALDIVDGSLPVTCIPASGSIFPLGTTTVNCSATDSNNNTTTGSFTVTVQDTTAPVIAQPANRSVVTNNNSGKEFVNYPLPATSDTVDGPGFATCTPAPGNIFQVGITTVTCTAVDAAGNVATPVTFTINLKYIAPIWKNSEAFIPVTGGEIINLDCNTNILVAGIELVFHNLCNHQTIVNILDETILPGGLPSGFTFVAGLDIAVFSENQIVNPLPTGAGVEMTFPLQGSQQDFAVLFWDGVKWVEIIQQIDGSELARILSTESANDLYKIISAEGGIYKALTAGKTGIFILVKK